ncbi:MAG: GntG family PLP-dependent aldolase [Myxococcota bacterium]
MTPVDLRSDTLTQPTDAMRQAMARAEVGDDVYREDPTARRLEEAAAGILGKEAAIFVPTGTMANQMALMLHCRRGEEVIIGKGAHLFYYEGGAGGAFAGVQFLEVGETGLFTAEEMEAAIKPDAYYLARTRLVALENTHNRGGGRVFPQADVRTIGEAARARGLSVHIDGARLWNAAAASGLAEAELTAPADSVAACFSKGLGAPIGSVLAGSAAFIEEAWRLRRMMGGGMRQVGVICAAALHALTEHRGRLPEDHEHAAELAQRLSESETIGCDRSAVETNIVNFSVSGSAEAFVRRASEAGVLLNAIGPHRIRAVTHLGVDRAGIERATDVLLTLAASA